MYKKSLVAAGLILGFSAHSIFAGVGSAGEIELNKRFDRFEQAKRSTLDLKSNSNDMILNTRNEYGNNKKGNVIITKNPFSNKTNKSKKPKENKPKPDSTERKKTFKEKYKTNKKKGNRNPNENSENEKTASKTIRKTKQFRSKKFSKTNKRLYGAIFNARSLRELTPEQRRQVYEMHKRYAKTREGQIILRTIQKAEGGGLLVLVGKGKGKSSSFKRYMSKLNTDTHPAYQFPKNMRCFFHSKYGCSTAAGMYQITKTNYDYFVKYLGIKDFSKESQDIMALELMRTGNTVKVPGSYQGRGYVEMMKNNRKNALRYGTDDWASSNSSRWKPSNVDYPELSEKVAREVDRERRQKRAGGDLKDAKYYQSWIDESEREANS